MMSLKKETLTFSEAKFIETIHHIWQKINLSQI